MTTRRHIILSTLASAFLAKAAHAQSKSWFEKTDFDKAMKAGESILVEIHATWCPVCKAQEPIIKSILDDRKFSSLKVFYVDFDSDKDVLRLLGAQKQSTLITFKGGKETGRSVGDTNPERLAALIAKAL